MTASAVHSVRSFGASSGRSRSVFRIGFLALLSVFCISVCHARDRHAARDAFLKAVAQVETGGNRWAVGKAGERGLYQFSRATWHQHTKRSFMLAHNIAVSHRIAVEHYEWIYHALARRGRATPYWIAVAWNAGLSRALAREVPKSTRKYARSVVNLFSVERAMIVANSSR